MPNTLEQKLTKKYLMAVNDYQLLANGDKILLGLSGGKDSLALLHFLAKSKAFPKLDIDIVAVHVAMENVEYDIDRKQLQSLCESYHIPFIYTKAQLTPPDKKDICFICSWTRRKVLFEIAQEYKCNKIALGHHKDDILETLLMNMMFQGSISTIPPALRMDKFEQTLIRPLCLIEEKDIRCLQDELQWPQLTQNCPHEKQSKRTKAKEILALMEQASPQVKNSLWRAMNNIQEKYLP